MATGDVAVDGLGELDGWIDEHWDPDATVGAWWDLLGGAGWAAPTLPPDRCGRGLTVAEGDAIAARLAERGVLGPPAGTGMAIVAPTLAAHADADARPGRGAAAPDRDRAPGVVPAVQRARRRHRPRLADDDRDARR